MKERTKDIFKLIGLGITGVLSAVVFLMIVISCIDTILYGLIILMLLMSFGAITCIAYDKCKELYKKIKNKE